MGRHDESATAGGGVVATGPIRERFYLETVRRLLGEGWMRPDDEVLVVAGGTADRDVLLTAGFRKVTISNLDERMDGDEYAPFTWAFQDAEDLSYADGAFDVCVVHQGLHHCASPHRGLLEMYRVARRCVLVFEPQETLLTRLGVRLGVGQLYELAAVADNEMRWGGARNSAVPNYVYRWTRREVAKALAAFDPSRPPSVRCAYDLRVPGAAAARLRRGPAALAARAGVPIARLVLRLWPAQANAVAFMIDHGGRDQALHPWLTVEHGNVVPDPAWFGRPAGAPPAAAERGRAG
jgi:ubiquinone/menaquinone biosynthesis C-methylase UbiE